MSSSEAYEPSDASGEDVQLTQQPQEQPTVHTSSSKEEAFLETPDRETTSPPHTALDDEKIKFDELPPQLRKWVKEDGATLYYNDKGQLSPVFPHPQGLLFKDRLSKSSWRNRTTDERNVAAALDQSRSGDLSVHLYNAFKLKQRARAQTPDENGFVETRKPPKGWTAWPLPPHLVPREHEEKNWEDEEWRAGPYVQKGRRPGDELRECLTARAVKTAKERFEARESESSPDGSEEGEVETAVVLADEEAATRILRPSVEHVLEKLDGVLMGMHYSRASYLRTTESKRVSFHGERLRIRSDDLKKTEAQRPDRGDGNNEDNSGSQVDANESGCSSIPSRKRPRVSTAENRQRAFARRKRRLGLRDWSDVLGVAAMKGIDSVIIGRAAARCSALLGESMSFRTLHESGDGDTDTIPTPVGNISSNGGELEPQEDRTDMYGGVHVDGFLKPIEGKRSWKYPVKSRKRSKTKEMESDSDE